MGFSNSNTQTTYANINKGRFIRKDEAGIEHQFNECEGNLEGIRLREREYNPSPTGNAAEVERFTDLELRFWDGKERFVVSGTCFRNGKIQQWGWMLLDRLASMYDLTTDRNAQPIYLTLKVWPNEFTTADGETRIATACTVMRENTPLMPLHPANETPAEDRVTLAAETIAHLQQFFPAWGAAPASDTASTPESSYSPSSVDDLPF